MKIILWLYFREKILLETPPANHNPPSPVQKSTLFYKEILMCEIKALSYDICYNINYFTLLITWITISNILRQNIYILPVLKNFPLQQSITNEKESHITIEQSMISYVRL